MHQEQLSFYVVSNNQREVGSVMGLVKQAESAVKAAFRAAGAFKTSVKLKVASSSFDPVTGETTQTWSEESGQGLLTEYSKWDIASGAVLANDRRLILRQSEFTSLSPDISSDSRIEIDSTLYQIIAPVRSGFANAVWDLQIRKA